MKKCLFLLVSLFIILSATQIKAQVISYKVMKINENLYSADMKAYNGWGGWNDNEDEGYLLSFSQNAFKIREPSYIHKKDDGEWTFTSYIGTSTYVLTFVADEPNTKFPFRKKVAIKYNSSVSIRKNREDDFKVETTSISGSGYVYSTETFDKIMGGNSIADIYFFFEMENGAKGYIGYNIKSQAMITREETEEERKAEAEEARLEKKRKEAETYKNLGKAIGTLLQKRKN